MGFMVAPGPPDVVGAEDRPESFVVLDLVKNEESDAEGRRIVSDIICGLGREGEREVLGGRAAPGVYDSRVTGSPVRFFLTPFLGPTLPFLKTRRRWLVGASPRQSSGRRRRRNRRRRKVNICVEYLAQGGRRSPRKFLSPDGSTTDHKTKQMEIEPTTVQEDDHRVEVKEERKKKKKVKHTEELASPKVEDTLGEKLTPSARV